MHYTGDVYRPPVEAYSVLLQVTQGCSHNSCNFCNMYKETCFKISPITEIEQDLREVHMTRPNADQMFLLGADAFVLSYEKLKEILILVREYLPNCRKIRAFARITNIENKTVEQLKELRALGMDYLYIGLETGDNAALTMSNKGYTAQQALEQLKKLDDTGIEYFIAYLLGLAGHGNGERSALATSELLNKLHPHSIGATNLILYPNTEFYAMQQRGEYILADELDKLVELKTLLEHLEIETFITADHASNIVRTRGNLPKDKAKMLSDLQKAIDNYNPDAMNFLRSITRAL